MVAVRTIGGPSFSDAIEEMDRELMEIIEDFDRAMNFEALSLASKLSLFRQWIVDP